MHSLLCGGGDGGGGGGGGSCPKVINGSPAVVSEVSGDLHTRPSLGVGSGGRKGRFMRGT